MLVQRLHKGNKILPIPEALNVIITRTISLLTMDVKLCKLIGISREMIEEALKSLKITPNILMKWSNAMWDVLLVMEKELAGNVLTTKVLQLQIKYMGTHQMNNRCA